MSTFNEELKRVSVAIYKISTEARNSDDVLIAIAGYMNTLVNSYLEQHNPDYYGLLVQAKEYNAKGDMACREAAAKAQNTRALIDQQNRKIDAIAKKRAKAMVKDLLKAFINDTFEVV